MAEYKLSINKKPYKVEANEQMPLLWVLRDKIGLRGTKFGCGRGLCGACTVHMDGQAIRSCSLPISAVGKAEITTIEGLSTDNNHPLQQAWQTLGVPQCGYCQSGQLMAAASLLQQHKNPSDQQIDEAMAGNICRCGTYQRIRKGIHQAAKTMQEEAKS